MQSILITGGTVFVSKYVAEYFVKQGNQVCVLNRNSRKQPAGATLIQADRHSLGDVLKGKSFDAIIDVSAYTAEDVTHLLDSGVSFREYVFISSSAVYLETASQPFLEEGTLGENAFWGSYGTNKIAAEQVLQERVPHAYILRPPYLYGSYNNVYREGFVFDCAIADRKFYLPKDGEMKPTVIYWENPDGTVTKYQIDGIVGKPQKMKSAAGGYGTRYLVQIGDNRRLLFLEKDKFFLQIEKD